MSLTGTPNRPSSDALPPGRLPLWRFALALLLALLPWLAVWLGLYRHGSALAAFACYHLVCFVGGYLLRSPGLPSRDRLYPLRRRALLAVVFAANGVTFLLYLLVGAALLDKPRVLGLLAERGLDPASYVWLFPYFALVNPLAEEYFWRGGVYATLRHLYGSPVPGALIAATLFGAWHWMVIRLFVAPEVALAATLVIVLVGLALTAVYEGTRRLAYPIILHALAGDAPLLLLLILVGRG